MQAVEQLFQHARTSRVRSVWLIWFVLFIWLIWFMRLVSSNQKNQTDQTNQITFFVCWRTYSAPCCQTSGICQLIGGNPASVRSRLMCEKHWHPKNFLTDKGEGCAHATTAWCDCVINVRFFWA